MQNTPYLELKLIIEELIEECMHNPTDREAIDYLIDNLEYMFFTIDNQELCNRIKQELLHYVSELYDKGYILVSEQTTLCRRITAEYTAYLEATKLYSAMSDCYSTLYKRNSLDKGEGVFASFSPITINTLLNSREKITNYLSSTELRAAIITEVLKLHESHLRQPMKSIMPVLTSYLSLACTAGYIPKDSIQDVVEITTSNKENIVDELCSIFQMKAVKVEPQDSDEALSSFFEKG